MGKALANKAPTHPTAECLTLIEGAMHGKAAWAAAYAVYSKVLGETDTGLSADEVKARSCINTLSGAEKELAIQAGMRAKLVGYFTAQANIDCELGDKKMLEVSQFVTGTLAAVAPTGALAGKKTQPMYRQADAELRGALMNDMVSRLNAKLQTPV